MSVSSSGVIKNKNSNSNDDTNNNNNQGSSLVQRSQTAPGPSIGVGGGQVGGRKTSSTSTNSSSASAASARNLSSSNPNPNPNPNNHSANHSIATNLTNLTSVTSPKVKLSRSGSPGRGSGLGFNSREGGSGGSSSSVSGKATRSQKNNPVFKIKSRSFGNFEGGMKDGMWEGLGVLEYTNGDVYSGSWAANERQGKGVFTWANGTYFDGIFESDRFVAGELFLSQRNQTFSATFVKDAPPGSPGGTLVNSNNNISSNNSDSSNNNNNNNDYNNDNNNNSNNNDNDNDKSNNNTDNCEEKTGFGGGYNLNRTSKIAEVHLKRGEKTQQFCKFSDGKVLSDLSVFDDQATSPLKTQLRRDSSAFNNMLSAANAPPPSELRLNYGGGGSKIKLGYVPNAHLVVCSPSKSKFRPTLEPLNFELQADLGGASSEEKYNIGNIGVYEGPWVNGKKHGIGNYRMPCGSIYTGPFVNGVKHGHATIKFGSSGEIFEGEVDREKMIGKCVYKWPDQSIVTPASANNPVAYTTKVYGKTYTGDYHYAYRFHGQGSLLYNETGNIIEGKFEHGVALIEAASSLYVEETGRKYNIYFTNPNSSSNPSTASELPGISVTDILSIYDVTLIGTFDGRLYRRCRFQGGKLLNSEDEVRFAEEEAVRLQHEAEERERKRIADEEEFRQRKEAEEEAQRKAEEAEAARKRQEARMKEEEKKRALDEQKRKRQLEDEEEARIAEEKRKKEEEEYNNERAKAKAKKEGNAEAVAAAEAKLKQIELDKAKLADLEKQKIEREKKEASEKKRKEQQVTVRLPNGNVYIGEVDEKGAYNGKGNLINKEEGYSYNGYFENGKRKGQGTLKSTVKFNVFEYTGSFELDKRHGKGRIVWPTGDSFEGDFFDNEITGKGLYTWSSSSSDSGNRTYQGEFQKSLKHGFGVFKWANGNIFEGTFDRNIMVKGKLFLATQNISYDATFSGGDDIVNRNRLYTANLSMAGLVKFKPIKFSNGALVDNNSLEKIESQPSSP